MSMLIICPLFSYFCEPEEITQISLVSSYAKISLIFLSYTSFNFNFIIVFKRRFHCIKMAVTIFLVNCLNNHLRFIHQEHFFIYQLINLKLLDQTAILINMSNTANLLFFRPGGFIKFMNQDLWQPVYRALKTRIKEKLIIKGIPRKVAGSIVSNIFDPSIKSATNQ